MVQRVGPVAVLWMCALLVGGASGAVERPEVTVAYSYSGSGTILGFVAGGCQAFGGVLASESPFSFHAAGVELVHVVTWVNRSSVRPGDPEGVYLATPLDYQRKESRTDLPDGLYHVESGERGVAALWPSGHPERAEPTLQVRFAGTDATWTSVEDGLSAGGHLTVPAEPGLSQVVMNGLGFHSGRYPDGTRGWDVGAGQTNATGSGVLHLRDARLEGPTVDLDLPPFPVVVQNTTAPLNGARITTYRLEEVFLHMEHVRADMATGNVRWACRDTQVEVDGEMTVLRATGNASLGDETHFFLRKVLTIQGVFTLQEAPVLGRQGVESKATASGEVEVIGIDFQVVAIADIFDLIPPEVGLLGLVAAAALVGAKKGLPGLTVLVSRFRGTDPLDHPVRKAIIETLEQHRALSQLDLVSVVGAARGTVRHHLEVLHQARLVSSLPVGGQTFVFRRGVQRDEVLLRLVREDQRLRSVHEWLAEGLERPAVTRRLVERFGVTSRTARKYVQKYYELVLAPEAGERQESI